MATAPVVLGTALQKTFNEYLDTYGGGYSKCEVLSMYWNDDDMGCIEEAKKVNKLFEDTFGYKVQLFGIPSERTESNLRSKINEFLSKDEEPDSLFIIYYGGHGDPDEKKDRRGSVWAANRETNPTVDWHRIQPLLKNAKADVLLILDCCYAAQAARGQSTHRFQLLAASGLGVETPVVGEKSFTSGLIQQILLLLDEKGYVAIPQLHRNLGKREAGLLQTPVHFCLSGGEKMPMILRPLLKDIDKVPSKIRESPRPVAKLILELSLEDTDASSMLDIATWAATGPPVILRKYCTEITTLNDNDHIRNPIQSQSNLSPPTSWNPLFSSKTTEITSRAPPKMTITGEQPTLLPIPMTRPSSQDKLLPYATSPEILKSATPPQEDVIMQNLQRTFDTEAKLNTQEGTERNQPLGVSIYFTTWFKDRMFFRAFLYLCHYWLPPIIIFILLAISISGVSPDLRSYFATIDMLSIQYADATQRSSPSSKIPT